MAANIIIQTNLSGLGTVMTDQQTYDAYRAAGQAYADGASSEDAIAAGQRAAGLDSNGQLLTALKIYPPNMSTLQKGIAYAGIGSATLGLVLFFAAKKKSLGTTLGLVGLAGIGSSIALNKLNIGG